MVILIDFDNIGLAGYEAVKDLIITSYNENIWINSPKTGMVSDSNVHKELLTGIPDSDCVNIMVSDSGDRMAIQISLVEIATDIHNDPIFVASYDGYLVEEVYLNTTNPILYPTLTDDKKLVVEVHGL